jgi:hypothetical protein
VVAVAGALTGLLFVAVPVKRAALIESPTIRFRAAHPLVQLRNRRQRSVGNCWLSRLYWLIPAVAASLIGGVVNAWQLLVRLPS